MTASVEACTYGSSYDEDTRHELVFLHCPACGHENEVDWSALERGARNECTGCGHAWLNGEVTTR